MDEADLARTNRQRARATLDLGRAGARSRLVARSGGVGVREGNRGEGSFDVNSGKGKRAWDFVPARAKTRSTGAYAR